MCNLSLDTANLYSMRNILHVDFERESLDVSQTHMY